jgi:hypothetical protein
MRKLMLAALVAAALATAAPASAADPRAGCVGQFSSYFASQGMRDDLARDFAQGARPAGKNVYSHVAEFHGDLEECFEQT